MGPGTCGHSMSFRSQRAKRHSCWAPGQARALRGVERARAGAAQGRAPRGPLCGEQPVGGTWHSREGGPAPPWGPTTQVQLLPPGASWGGGCPPIQRSPGAHCLSGPGPGPEAPGWEAAASSPTAQPRTPGPGSVRSPRLQGLPRGAGFGSSLLSGKPRCLAGQTGGGRGPGAWPRAGVTSWGERAVAPLSLSLGPGPGGGFTFGASVNAGACGRLSLSGVGPHRWPSPARHCVRTRLSAPLSFLESRGPAASRGGCSVSSCPELPQRPRLGLCFWGAP